ncbi:hypothetical protein D9M69_382090 [compost metagenome]
MPVVGDQQQAGGGEVQAPTQVQLVLVGLVEQVEHGGMLRVLGGADVTGRLVEHEIARRLAGLEHALVQFHTIELADFDAAVSDRLAVHPDPTGGQQQARVEAAEFGEIAQESIKAHQLGASDGSACAQRGQRQARSISGGGMRSSAAGSIFAVKHQHASPARAGSAWVHWLLWPHSGQRVGSDGVLMTAVRGGKGARVQPCGPGCKSGPMRAVSR